MLQLPYAGAATHQHTAPARGLDRQHGRVRQALCATPVLDAASGDPEQAMPVAHQSLPVRQRQHGLHAFVRQSGMRAADVAQPAIALQAEERVVRADPQRAIRPEPQHGHVRQRTRLSGQAFPATFMDTHQSRPDATQAQHHAAARVGHDGAHALHFQPLHGAGVVRRETATIETRGAFPGPRPQVALGVLANRMHQVVRQAVFHRPVRERVLVHPSPRIERPRGHRGEQRQQAKAGDRQAAHGGTESGGLQPSQYRLRRGPS